MNTRIGVYGMKEEQTLHAHYHTVASGFGAEVQMMSASTYHITLQRGDTQTMELVPAWHNQEGMQLVLRTNRHLVVYDHNLRQISLRNRHSIAQEQDLALSHEQPNYRESTSYACPLCLRPWTGQDQTIHSTYKRQEKFKNDDDDSYIDVSPQYFRLLSQSAHVGPAGDIHASNNTSSQGYYEKFFIELSCLGRGAHGSVYLCQHVLHGHTLGRYAVKKIPIGDHNENLLSSLHEVHLMETLIHPNIINYKHAWVEMAQISPFTPCVPTLHVLMMAANGGSLADWISARAGGTGNKEEGSLKYTERVERLKAEFKQRRAKASRREHFMTSTMGIHFLREDEIVQLLRDIAQGLEFLHEHNILHLDIKPGNVLLHWEDDALLPTAMISDFGSSLTVQQEWMHKRTGNTGTIEYMAPEAIVAKHGQLLDLTSKADIWSLGILLHLLIFFELPYSQVDDIDILRQEIADYSTLDNAIQSKGLYKRFCRIHPMLASLLRQMLHLDPSQRPNCRNILDTLDDYESQIHADMKKGPRGQPFDLNTSASLIPRQQIRVPSSPETHPIKLLSKFDDRCVIAWAILMGYAQMILLDNASWVRSGNLTWIRHILWLALLAQISYAYVFDY